jgi:hypothetical protein
MRGMSRASAPLRGKRATLYQIVIAREPNFGAARLRAGAFNAMSLSCPDRERLLEELRLANQEVNAIHQDEATAATNHDFDAFGPLEQRLKQARMRRDRAAETLKRHLEEHRCS